MSTYLALRRRTADQWYRNAPDKATRQFHNMVTRDPVMWSRLAWLLSLFAEDPPQGRGVYNHHDGPRT